MTSSLAPRGSSRPPAFRHRGARRAGGVACLRSRGSRHRRHGPARAGASTGRPPPAGVVVDLPGVTFTDSSPCSRSCCAPARRAATARLVIAGPARLRRVLDSRAPPTCSRRGRPRERSRCVGARPLAGPDGRRRPAPASCAALARARSHEKPACRKSLPAEAASTVVEVRPAAGRAGAGRPARARSTRPCSACSSAARRPRSAGAGRAGACPRRAAPRRTAGAARSRPSRARSAWRARTSRRQRGSSARGIGSRSRAESAVRRAAAVERAQQRVVAPRSASGRRASPSDRQRVRVGRQRRSGRAWASAVRIRPGRRAAEARGGGVIAGWLPAPVA